jgi:hypothetical protein
VRVLALNLKIADKLEEGGKRGGTVAEQVFANPKVYLRTSYGHYGWNRNVTGTRLHSR